MSYLIPEDSPKFATAQRFGRALRRARETRRLSVLQIEEAIGWRCHTSFYHWQQGRMLPKTSVAAQLAQILEWPELLEIVRSFRTKVCPIDGRTFVDEGGTSKKTYCSGSCRERAARDRARMHSRVGQETAGYLTGDPARVLVARLEQELERTRQAGTAAVRRREVRAAIKQWQKDSASSMHRRLQRQLADNLAAVEAMCHGCEPEGLCRTIECPLRPVSPLPFVEPKQVGMPVAKEDWRKNPSAETRARRSASMKAMYEARPERREEIAERSRHWWAGLTPEERLAHMAKVNSSRRKPRAQREVA